MKNEYQKPKAEIISLLALEKIATEEYSDGFDVDGSMGTYDSIFG